MAFIKLQNKTSSSLTSDRLFLSVLIFACISILGQISLFLVSWGKLPPQIPFFYSSPWGEMQLASPFFLWTLPSITILFSLINFLAAIFIVGKYYFLTRVLVIFSALVAFATLYDSAKIISLLI